MPIECPSNIPLCAREGFSSPLSIAATRHKLVPNAQADESPFANFGGR
jgi:hypothetical protein